MNFACIIALISLIIATPALAHEDVKNSTVKARIMAMSSIVSNMRTLGGMAKGAVAFDLDQAKAALANINKISKTMPALFKDKEMDPKSEALPAIWTNFSDFTARSEAMEGTAAKALANFSSQDDLIPSMRALGGTCKACHSTYRK